MLRFLKMHLTPHLHDWSIIGIFEKRDWIGNIGKRIYVLRCAKCGYIKKREIS